MLSASQSLHLSSHEHIALTSQKQISITSEDRFITSVVNGIRAFSQKEGIKLYAGKDDVELQAQDGKLEAIARHDVQVISTEGGIEVVSPNVVSIKVGGTELKITPEGVFITTPGIFRVKAGEHVLEGGDRVLANLPHFPKSGAYSRRFDLSEIFNPEILPVITYNLINHDKSVKTENIFDEENHSIRVFSDKPQNIELELIADAYLQQIPDDFERTLIHDLDEEEEDDDGEEWGCLDTYRDNDEDEKDE